MLTCRNCIYKQEGSSIHFTSSRPGPPYQCGGCHPDEQRQGFLNKTVYSETICCICHGKHQATKQQSFLVPAPKRSCRSRRSQLSQTLPPVLTLGSTPAAVGILFSISQCGTAQVPIISKSRTLSSGRSWATFFHEASNADLPPRSLERAIALPPQLWYASEDWKCQCCPMAFLLSFLTSEERTIAVKIHSENRPSSQSPDVPLTRG